MSADGSSAKKVWPLRVKWISLAVILLSVLLLMRTLPLESLRQSLHRAVESWGVWGPVFYGLIYAVAVVFLIPASLLTLAAGAIFGLGMGTVLVSLSATTGAAMAFLIARYAARDQVQARVRQSPKLAAVDRAIGTEGWKIVALLRLSPAVPFTLQNYLYGVTAIPFWPCVLTSWITMLPGTFMYVYLGSLGSSAVSGQSTTGGEWALRGLGLLATIVVTVYITRVAKRAMTESLDLPASEPEPTHKSPHKPSLVKTGFWILAAITLLTLAITAQFQTQAIHNAIEHLLG